MSSNDRRSAARRRAWGRGPTILRFEPLEGRELLSAVTTSLSSGSTSSVAGAGDSYLQALNAQLNAATPGTTIQTSASSQNAAASANALSAAVSSAASSGTLVPTSALSGSSTVTPAASSTSTATSTVSPNLVTTAFNAPSSLAWGDSFTASGTIQNTGNAATTAASEIDVYASTSTAPNSDSLFLGAIPVSSGVAAGASTNFSQSFKAPSVPITNLGSASTYYLDAVLMPAGYAAGTESTSVTSANDGVVTSGTADQAVTVTTHASPLLVGSGIAISSSSVAWGGTVTVTSVVQNAGEGDAPATNAKVVLTPQDQKYGGNFDFTIGYIPVPAIAAGQSATVSQTFTLPTYAPTELANETAFNVAVVQDADNAATVVTNPMPTLTSGQNLATLTVTAPAVAPTTPQPAAADLTVASVTEPSTEIDEGSTVVVGATVQNTGTGNAGPYKVKFLLSTSVDPTVPAISLGEVTVPGTNAGYAQDIYKSVTIPYNVNGNPLSGSVAVIIAQVDPDHTVNDSTPGNNYLVSKPVTLGIEASSGAFASDAQSLVTYAGKLTTTTVTTPTPNTAAVSSSSVSATETAIATTTTTTTTTATTAAATRKANALARAEALQARLEAQKLKLQAQIQAHYAKLQAQKVARASITKVRATNSALKIHKA